MATLYPVIMCGGAGTRLWPLSRKAAPKQYHALVTDKTMLQETVLRAAAAPDGVTVAAPSFVCAAGHKDVIKTQCSQLGITPHAIFLEPMGRNTAAVAAMIAQELKQSDPEATILLLPADHHITDVAAFWDYAVRGLEASNKGYIVTLGIQPDGPETGYGYIKTGKALTGQTCYVDQFVEKPDRETAQGYLASGDYFWNAGIFLFSAQAMCAAFEAHAPDILTDCTTALGGAAREGSVIALKSEDFKRVRSEPVDIAIMEQSDKVAIVPGAQMGWSDIGSWAALGDLSQNGEGGDGEVIAIDCTDSYIRSDGPLVAAIGVSDLIVVATADAVLILPKDRAQDVKQITADLKAKDYL